MQSNEKPEPLLDVSSAVVLSGASGMLGAALRSALVGRQIRVLQLVRGAALTPGQIAWNPAAGPAIANTSALEGCRAAIHLSGAGIADHRWNAAYRRELTVSRVDSTRSLATILAGLRPPPRVFLVASAIGFYGDRGDEVLDEKSAPGTGFLAELCRRWEAAAQPAVEAGIRVVHLRSGVVLGRGKGALGRMLPPFRLGLGGRLGSGRQWMSWISLDDAISAMLFALETTSIAGPLNLTAPHPVTNAEFTAALGRQLRRPAVMAVPAFALRLAFGQMADETLLASDRAVPLKLLEAGFEFAHPRIEQALAAVLD